jgi:hypothetical protein
LKVDGGGFPGESERIGFANDEASDSRTAEMKRTKNDHSAASVPFSVVAKQDADALKVYTYPELRRLGFAANRRMLEIEQISHECTLGEDAFQDLQHPRHVHGERASALRFADPNVQALLCALVMFVFVARDFTNQDLRQAYAVLLGLRPGEMGPGRMSYELQRLRLQFRWARQRSKVTRGRVRVACLGR